MRWPFVVALTLASHVAFAQAPGGDIFNVNPGGGPPPPRPPASAPPTGDYYGRDTECGGTDRRSYDNFYHTQGVIIPYDQLAAVEQQQWQYEFHCSACGQNAICWRVYKGLPPTLPNQPPAPPIPGPPTNPQQSASDCAGLVAQARATAAAIQGGNTGPGPMIALTKVLQHCPPAFPRPIDCFDMMVDAQSKLRTNPEYSRRRAQQALDCYEGKRPDIRQTQQPRPVETSCQDTPDSGSTGQRPRTRSDLEIDRSHMAVASAGLVKADYQMAQSNTPLQGGVTVFDKPAEIPVKRNGRTFCIKVQQYNSDVCEWWYRLRLAIANEFEARHGQLPLMNQIHVAFNVTVNDANQPRIIFAPPNAGTEGAQPIYHWVGNNQYAALGIYVQNSEVWFALADLLKAVNVPPLPQDMVRENLSPETVEDVKGTNDKRTKMTFAHGVYFVDSFSVLPQGRPAHQSIFARCYLWMKENHPDDFMAAGGAADPPSSRPQDNTDLDPS